VASSTGTSSFWATPGFLSTEVASFSRLASIVSQQAIVFTSVSGLISVTISLWLAPFVSPGGHLFSPAFPIGLPISLQFGKKLFVASLHLCFVCICLFLASSHFLSAGFHVYSHGQQEFHYLL
jgi:hypothetical protein